MTRMDKLMAEFRTPGRDCRGAPFWAWNGALEPAELRRQIRSMKAAGLGGFFMHARQGLDTEYLSEDWFECVRACIDEAEKQDMNAWIYDEDRWPSGAAGGLVTKKPEYRTRQLKIEILKTAKGFKRTQETLAVFTTRIEGSAAYEVKPVPARKVPAPAAGESILVFSVVIQPPAAWFNNQTYVDTLNPAAIREFIKVTYEAYRKHCGRDFGKRVPGVFTDEPNPENMMWTNPLVAGSAILSWTPKLPEVFRKRYGYDLLPHLPELVFDVEGKPVTPARYHYHDCVTHLFVDSFARQIGEWCGKHGLQFTGHVLDEDTLLNQTSSVGSCMRFYEHMQAPGMDALTERSRIFSTAKQVSSVARQFGRKWRLTETYGCTGWDFPFAGHKALGDWQLALGINLRCHHHAWYTMLGEAKRDYPGAISHQSPWWPYYGKVEDYFARVVAVMTRGTEVRDILVVHSVESMWLMFKAGWRQQDRKARAMNGEFAELAERLLGAHLDFDYGDEELMSRHARVTRKNGRAILRVGKAEYKVVVVPPQVTMRCTTLQTLKKFKAAGGEIVFSGAIAEYVNAVKSDEVRALAGRCERLETAEIGRSKALESQGRRISIQDAAGHEITPALYLLREDGDNFYLFLCNTGEEFANSSRNRSGDGSGPALEPGAVLDGSFDDCVHGRHGMVRDRTLAFAEVRIRGFAGCAGAPVELNPETGFETSVDAQRRDDGWEIRTSLPALGSRLFVVSKKATVRKTTQPVRLVSTRTERLDDSAWAYRMSEDNVLVLDRCRYRLRNGDWQMPMEVLRVDGEIRKVLGLVKGVQPWARGKLKVPRTIPVELTYEFEVELVPSGALWLAVERPASFEITLNRGAVDTNAEAGWWTDRSLRKLPLDPMLLRPGRNEIRMKILYPETFSGLEIVYLLGLFGVAVKGTKVSMTALPERLRVGDWCEQGLPFYSGNMAYCRTVQPGLEKGERAVVVVPDYRGVAVRVLVGGKCAGVVGWEPNEVDITDLLGDQPVELAIEVLGHRRNSHGPFHGKEKWPSGTGPGSYEYQAENWFEGYQLVPCGLMQSPRLEFRVPNGIC